VLAALGAGFAAVVSRAQTAPSAADAPAPAPVAAESSAALPAVPRPPVDSLHTLRTSSDSLAAGTLQLKRAIAARRAGDTRGMIALLETLDFRQPHAFADADRAAFLLGVGLLESGSEDHFVTLARQVAAWPASTSYTKWIAYQLALLEAQGAALNPDSTHAAFPDSSLGYLASASPALAALLQTRSMSLSGADREREMVEAAATDTSSQLSRDLAGEALLRQANGMLARGEDPTALLELVPSASRYGARARHLIGLIAIEHGDSLRGQTLLSGLLAGDSTYEDARAVRLALAGQELEAEHWEAAERSYRTIDEDWSRENAELRGMVTASNFDTLWPVWSASSASSPVLALDTGAVMAGAESLATASLDLASRPSRELPPLDARPLLAWRWPVAPPPPDAMRAVSLSAAGLNALRYEREGAIRDADLERRSLAERRRYLTAGRERARQGETLLGARAAELDSLRRTLSAIDRQLMAVRDSATLHLTKRLGRILDRARDHELWMNAMRFYDLSGPALERPLRVPAGYPGPDSVLAAEQALTRAVAAVAESMAFGTPGLIARSYRDAWRPGLIERSDSLGLAAGRLLALSRALGAELDSCVYAAGTSPELMRLQARIAALDRSTDSMQARHDALRARVAGQAVENALAAMNDEREGIDYGLAAATYGLATHLGQPDSLEMASRVAPAAAGADSGAFGTADVKEDPATAAWRAQAIDRMQSFLARHPESSARGEMRFRLADLLLVDARQNFREQMARYLEAQAAGQPTGRLPLLADRPALDLYVAMLQEDPDFPHRDAVLFNAAMILADDGDPRAVPYFNELVTAHPESPYCQESYLRMADLNFNDRDFKSGVALYQRAAAGRDTSLSVTALYKMGWAEYNSEHYLEAVDAFRRVLDLYDAPGHSPIAVDVHKEAEADLIQTLARAGGARAFAMYFDTLGTRPYEMKVLMSLAQYQRRYSLYADAAASEELALSRYPLAPEALENAQLLSETYRRWERPELVRDAQLKYASQFAPNSAWAKAQSSDSVRAAGSEFARSGLKSVALEHHLAARKSQNPWEWREALQLYETILANWPDDPDAPALQLNAGEASASVGDYPAALAHYAVAAKTGPDSTVAFAMWQRVAVTDTWYEATRQAGTGPKRLGNDSLATAVMIAADQLLERYPQHPRSADLLWREGNLAFAHGWYERSAADFDRLASRHRGDARTPVATMMRGDAFLHLNRFEDAGVAYEQALAAARTAGVDSLARRAERAIPICYYREAEAAVAADSSAYEKHAQLFEKVAARFPGYEHADLAQYRAGLAYLKAGKTEQSVLAMQTLIRQFPNSDFVRDANLQIARTWEDKGEKEKAAQAYADFIKAFPADSMSRDVWLKAADLYAAAGLTDRADELHLAYVHKYPGDVAAAMDFLEDLARRELKTVNPQHPISALIPPEPPARPKSKKGAPPPARSAAKAAATAAAAGPPSHLAQYLKLAAIHPDLASKPLIAEIRFDQGEEAFAAYSAAAIRQPLQKSIPAKQKLLDAVLSRFRECVNVGVPEWSHAATYRLGQALVGFGESLEKSERPADIKGDDLTAYDEVLRQQAQPFYDRGEGVWTELLRQKSDDSSGDKWVAQAQSDLFKRMADRFYFRPEPEYPLVAAVAADKVRPEKPEPAPRAESKSKSGGKQSSNHSRGTKEHATGVSSQENQP